MSYKYSEPKENEFEPLPEGDYGFEVVAVEPTYENERGTFILPVEIRLRDTNRKVKHWLSAGVSVKGNEFDMIAPFLKCIQRQPKVGTQPDFSSRNLIGCVGIAHIVEKEYNGTNDKYKGKKFPSVEKWIYDQEESSAPPEDDIPF